MRRNGIRGDGTQIIGERWELRPAEIDVILDALNVRAMDHSADRYGDAGADAAADLYQALTGAEPDEKESM